MKKVIMITLCALSFVCNISFAETYQFDFTYTKAPPDSFTLYENVMDKRVTIKEGIAQDARSFDIDLDPPTTGCRTFFMAPVFEWSIGKYGNAAGICAEEEIPGEITISNDAVSDFRVKMK